MGTHSASVSLPEVGPHGTVSLCDGSRGPAGLQPASSPAPRSRTLPPPLALPRAPRFTRPGPVWPGDGSGGSLCCSLTRLIANRPLGWSFLQMFRLRDGGRGGAAGGPSGQGSSDCRGPGQAARCPCRARSRGACAPPHCEPQTRGCCFLSHADVGPSSHSCCPTREAVGVGRAGAGPEGLPQTEKCPMGGKPDAPTPELARFPSLPRFLAQKYCGI